MLCGRDRCPLMGEVSLIWPGPCGTYHEVKVCQLTDQINPFFLFQIVIIYMTTQNVVNLNQSYFPMYLTETLHFQKVNNFLLFWWLFFRFFVVLVRILTSFSVFFSSSGSHCLLPLNDFDQWNSYERSGKTTQQILLKQGKFKCVPWCQNTRNVRAHR